MERWSVSPHWPTSIGEKGRTLGKTYSIKVRCYWEQALGTHWEPREHNENLMGTCWEQRKNWKKKFGILKPSERKFVVYVEPCTYEFASLEIGRDIMPTPQGWEEIMHTCRCKNPPIHKPCDVHRFFIFIFSFFHIFNAAKLAFIPNTV
jgi:hypothetical protein